MQIKKKVYGFVFENNYNLKKYLNKFFCIIFRDEDDDEQVVKKVEISECQNEIQEGEIGIHCEIIDGQPILKSDKEKECWALFKKMTAKGVSVTFDTVLRLENID